MRTQNFFSRDHRSFNQRWRIKNEGIAKRQRFNIFIIILMFYAVKNLTWFLLVFLNCMFWKLGISLYTDLYTEWPTLIIIEFRKRINNDHVYDQICKYLSLSKMVEVIYDKNSKMSLTGKLSIESN
jgi:hypothetical protein